jgi:glycosyltransferase involved in cell wall biosynthesis
MANPDPLDDRRRLRIMTLDATWYGGGGQTFNRLLSESLAEVGHEVVARVSEPVQTQPRPRLTVQGMEPVPGIDARGQLLRTDGLPRGMDVIIGHGRFSSGAATYLRDYCYPAARAVHIMHVLPDELDRWRGDPEQATSHARTERLLVARSDLVVGVGPLLTDEAARIAQMCNVPPAVHEMIPGVTVHAAPEWRDHQQRANLLLFGRVDDQVKGADIAAHAARVLRDRGHQVQLTILGAHPRKIRDQELSLSIDAGFQVKVKPFTTDPTELAAEIRGADVVLMPSRNEGFGLVAFEAAGHGVPVLVPGNSGVGIFLADPRRLPADLGKPCVVPTTGAEPDLPQRWADHLDRLLSDLPTARRQAVALRDHLGMHYTWARAAQALVARLEEGELKRPRPAAALTVAQLRERVAAYAREEARAPRWVADEVRDTSHAAARYRRRATAFDTAARDESDPQRRAELSESAVAYTVMADRLDQALGRLKEAEANRARWYLQTAAARALADAARVELRLRGEEPGGIETAREDQPERTGDMPTSAPEKQFHRQLAGEVLTDAQAAQRPDSSGTKDAAADELAAKTQQARDSVQVTAQRDGDHVIAAAEAYEPSPDVDREPDR